MKLSECCSAPVWGDESDICSACKEHTDFYNDVEPCPFCGDTDGKGKCTEQFNCLNTTREEEAAMNKFMNKLQAYKIVPFAIRIK